MGQIANILDFRSVRRGKAWTADSTDHNPASSPFARLVPGIAEVAWNKHLQSAPFESALSAASPAEPSLPLRISQALLPQWFERFEPSMLVPAAIDLASITSLFAAQRFLLHSQPAEMLPLRELCIFLLAFSVFALVEGLYSSRRVGIWNESAAVLRTLCWVSLLLGFAHRSAALPIARQRLAFTAAAACLLSGGRWLRARFGGAGTLKNVLIVGSGPHAQRVAASMRRDLNTGLTVKGFIAENHVRNVYAGAMLARLAREEFIDEIVVASSDRAVIEAAVQQARKNLLDISFAPDLPQLSEKPAIESTGDVPLFRWRVHEPPACSLALKRMFDVATSGLGLVALTPLFLVIAVLIKVDSRGPALYRARRIGRKGQAFCCYKFRTMIDTADAVKESLRSLNERKGAFFKIGNDPRVTRIGSLLRRYSLDELPQLWNVLIGDMSLVGPRPHPLDDASRYELHHLQRLDFVPGITGLWQITARRDPSFERSVALDVEYIKSWNFWLDLRILWRTIFVVIEGSGA